MTKLAVTDGLVRQLVAEVAPLVAHLTGWNLQLGDLAARVLPRHRGYEEIVLGRLAAAGIRMDPDAARNPLELLMEFMLEQNIAAAYDHGRQEILVVRENVDDSNMDGLRLTLAHELVHRGQHVHHPRLFRQVDEVVREAYGCGVEGQGTMAQAVRRLHEADRIMTVMESHAGYVEREIKRLYLPRAVQESHFNLPALLFRVLGSRKVAQYTGGIPAVAQATRAGHIDALYQALG
jgi:hypothetical protein